MFQGMEYMYAVYEEKSFSKAAKRLFISQPSLSATVKRVEERLGYPVFDRSCKPLKLTEFGEQYIAAVEKMRGVEHQFSDFINDWGNLQVGTLALGGSNLFSSWVLPQLMQDFARNFPLIKLELTEENITELVALLQNGKIDLLIENCSLDEMVFERMLFREEHLMLAVPRQFEINDKLKEYQVPIEDIRNESYREKAIQEVPLTAFSQEPFIVLKPENDTRKRAMDIFREQKMEPRILFELDQQMTSYNITCTGMGISFISDILISRVPFHDQAVYYKLPEKYSRRDIWFYWKRGKYFNRAMEEFLKMAGKDQTAFSKFR